jgi:hypothetical protein
LPIIFALSKREKWSVKQALHNDASAAKIDMTEKISMAGVA